MRWVREHYLKRVLVHTLEGATYDGLLQASERAAIVLVEAKYHGPGDESAVPLAGETYIPRERIAFMQRPAAVK